MTTYTKKFKEFIQEYNPDPNDYVVGYRKLDDSEIKIPLIAIDNSITAGKYLRRDIDDYANGLIGFRRGATFGSNVMSTIYLQGLTGWLGDTDGNFEMNSLRIREFLEVPEIRKNKITVMGNQFWFTDSAMIETALPLGGNKYNVYFKLEDLEYASFELNDILKGIYHYDSGFYTVYLRVYELILNPDTAGEIGVRVESLNGQLPMQSMLLARMNNSSDKDRLGSVFVDGINKYLRVLDGYNPSKPTSEGDLSTLKVLLGDLSSIKGHPTFGDLEGYGAYLENAYVSGKIIVKNDPNRPGQELGVYRGLWNSVDTYYKYDQVTYKGSLYTSKQVGNTGNIPTGGVDDIWWELTVEKGGDGTSGLSNYTLELSNDNHTIPTDSNGDNPSYGGASSTAYVFEGTNDISNVYTITAKVQLPATGTTLLIVLNGNTATITYIDKSLDAATIMFTATAEGYPTLSKAWSISKVKSGDDATAYWLVTDSPIIKKLNNGLFLPDPFVIRAFSQTGAGDILPFDGYIKISYGSQVDVVSGAVYLFSPIADVKSYITELYKDSQTSILLDKEIVSVVQDGVNQDWLLYIFKSSIGQPGTPTYTSPPNLYPTPEGWLDYPNDAVSIWWMSTSTVNGVTNAIAKWSTPVKVTGEDGANGKDAPWTDFKFKKNNDYNSAPSITPTDRFPTGWTDMVPVVLRGEYLWMTNAVINPDNSLKTTWSIPVRISGELGPQGERGEQGLTGKDGLQGPSIVFGGKWLSDRQYYCYADTQTAVFYNNRYYYTKAVSPAISPVTIPMGIGNNPSTAEGKVYWSEFAGQFDSVATGLLLAERIATAELTANKLFIVDRDESTGDIIAADGSKITKEQEKAMSSTQMIGLLTKGWFMDQGVIRSIAVLDDNTTPKLKLDSDGTIIATGVNVSGTVHFLDGTIANMQVFKDGRWTDTVNGPFPASNGAYYLRKNTGVTISPQGHIIGKDYFLTGDSTIGPSVFIGDVYVPGYTVPGLDNTSLSSFINLFNSLFEKVLVGSLYHIKAKLPLFSVGELTAYGNNSSTIPSIWDGIPVDKTTIDLIDGKLTVIGGSGGGGGTGLIKTVYSYPQLGGSFSDTTLTDTFNAYTINKIHTDFISHTHPFISLTSKPTTLSGYGITDGVLNTDIRLTNSRPASDVYPWAKAVDKPSYSYGEITGTPPTADLPDMIKSWENTPESDTNLYTAKKAMIELLKKALRRDQPDQTEHLFKALAGMEFGKFNTGIIGGAGSAITIDKDGKSTYEGDRMVLREELVVPKITFNCTDIISGDKANTFSFGTIKSVDKENMIATLDLIDDQVGTPDAGDICRGVFHNIEGGNQSSDYYDSNGFMNYSGFSTTYFTPTAIIESKPGIMRFKYSLQAGVSMHPIVGMNFFAYGSFTNKDRQSITYENRYYTRRLKNVNTWVINPDRNIAMQDGLLDGLTIGGMSMKGHGTFMENCYFTGTQIQFTPEQKEELAGQDAYSVSLSSYGGSVVVDSDGSIIGGLTEDKYVVSGDNYIVSGDKYLAASLYQVKTIVQCFKGEKELFYSTEYTKGGYMISINPVGCKALVDSGIVAITEVTDPNSCYIDITVNCEGNVVFNKLFSISVLKNGSSPVIADIDNEMASVACDKDGLIVSGLPVSTNVSMWYGATQLVLDAIDLELPAGVIAVSDTITGAVTITECNTSTIVNKIGIVVRATYAGDSYSKRLSFVLNKILPGADGKSPTIYSIYTTSNSVKLDNNATYTPTSVGAYVMKTEGSITSQLTALPTGLTLHFAWVPDGVLTSITNGQFLSARDFQDVITFVLKKDGVVIDKEVIPIIRDGSDGSDGVNGADGGFTQLRYRNSLSLPSTPSGSDPSGWRLSPDDVRSIDSYTGSFQLKDGYYESPYPSSSSVLYTSRISLTTTLNSQIVFIELDLQTGSDSDRVYVSTMNNSYVNGGEYTWVGWGTKKVIFPMIIPYYGGNFFEIAYKKNSAVNTYGDKVRYRIIEVNRCWLSTAYIRANTPTTWSVPTEFMPDTDKEERIYIRSKRNLTVDLPTSDEFVNDYIGAAPIYDNLKAYTVGNIVRYQISSNFVYKVCISNCVGKTPTLTDYWDDIEWWKDDPSGATAEYPYEFTCLRNKENGRWSYYKQYQLFLKYAKDGEDANILVSSVTQIGLSKTGAYEPSSFIVYHKNPKGDLLNTYLAAYGSDNGSSWTMLGSVQNSSSITVNVAVYPYRYYVIRSYRTGNINYTSEYLLSTSVNTIKDGSDGAVGPSGAQPRNRGFFKVGTEYTYDRLYRDIVLYNFGSFTYVFQVKTYGATISTPPTSSTGDNNWESADKYSFVAMDTALIDGANIAGFMYKNQVMLSSAGTLDGIKKDVGEVASDQQYLFEPNVTLDGNTGRMSGNLRSPYIPFKTMAAMQDSWNWSWFIHDWTTYSAVNGSMFGIKFKYNGIRFRIMNSYTIAISIYIPFQFSGKSDSTLSKINIAPGTRFEGEFIPRAKSFGLSNIEDGLSYPYSVVLFGVSPLTDNGIISDPTYTSIQTYTTKTV